VKDTVDVGDSLMCLLGLSSTRWLAVILFYLVE
jgi:hypothetical protein